MKKWIAVVLGVVLFVLFAAGGAWIQGLLLAAVVWALYTGLTQEPRPLGRVVLAVIVILAIFLWPGSGFDTIKSGWGTVSTWFSSFSSDAGGTKDMPESSKDQEGSEEDVDLDQRAVGAEGSDDRVARLVEMDEVYRSKGWQAWLEFAGVTCDADVEARQPEEETVVHEGETRIVVSGLQVDGHCEVPYPAIVTTGDPSVITVGKTTRQYQPDLRNPSVLYTNVVLDGDGTIWVDVTNWGQLDPTE